MKYDFRPSPDFVKGVKTLAKRYPSLKTDLQELRNSLEQNPDQGIDLGGGLRKIRMNIRSKGRGKASSKSLLCTFNPCLSSGFRETCEKLAGSHRECG